MHLFKDKTIGVWGLGKVGISVINLLQRHNISFICMDAKKPDWWKDQYTYIPQTSHKLFFDAVDYIVPSPGIDIRSYYNQYKTKWICELDLFARTWHKPIIAITGSVGKTTVTHLLGQLLKQYGLEAAVGGNIGTPMLDLIENQDKCHIAIIEVSSFQLEYCTQFSPDIAIWTNFFPNHLDRHTLEEYFRAKTQIVTHQHETQRAIIPCDIFQQLSTLYTQKRFLICCSHDTPCFKDDILQHTLLYREHDLLIKKTDTIKMQLIDMSLVSPITFTSNWITILAALDSLGLSLSRISQNIQTLTIPEHRMEKIVGASVTYYNDSKSTTPTATLCAIDRLHSKQIRLFLGGLSKGIDRSDLIQKLAGKVEKIYCFGKESISLGNLCTQYMIPTSMHETLEGAFETCMRESHKYDILLFSPAGSSYDLFTDYQERGKKFKQLIDIYEQTTG